MSFTNQPRTGINQKPLVFAQIRQGVSAPEVSKARVVESSRVLDISSNRFLHLFYRKPHMEDMGYDHGLDGLATFRVKTSPDARVPDNAEMLAAGATDVGGSKSVSLSERQFLTMSDCSSWEWKPSVKVADFFANSLGVPIECWTPCSRIQMARELEEADLIKFELECGAGESQDCAMTAGELALALNNGDASDFDPFDDLHGEVQLSVLFVNAHPDIQPLDFRLRMRIMRCECEPICYVHADSGKVIKANDGVAVSKGDLARLGMNQTCLAVAFDQQNGSVGRTAMKYGLFPQLPRSAYEYTINNSNAEAAPRSGRTFASVSAASTEGVSNRLALQDVWCTRAGQVLGISRSGPADSSGNRLPLFNTVVGGEQVDAAGSTLTAGHAEHKMYADSDSAFPAGSAKRHWRDFCHYAGDNAGKFGANDGKTVQLDQDVTFALVNNSSLAQAANGTKKPSVLFEDIKDVKASEKGEIQDTSADGEASDALPEAVAERLL